MDTHGSTHTGTCPCCLCALQEAEAERALEDLHAVLHDTIRQALMEAMYDADPSGNLLDYQQAWNALRDIVLAAGEKHPAWVLGRTS